MIITRWEEMHVLSLSNRSPLIFWTACQLYIICLRQFLAFIFFVPRFPKWPIKTKARTRSEKHKMSVVYSVENNRVVWSKMALCNLQSFHIEGKCQLIVRKFMDESQYKQINKQITEVLCLHRDRWSTFVQNVLLLSTVSLFSVAEIILIIQPSP